MLTNRLRFPRSTLRAVLEPAPKRQDWYGNDMIGRTILSALATTLLATGAEAQARWSAGATEIAGTYAVTICRGSCDTRGGGQVLTRGHLVLEGSSYRLASLPDEAERYFRKVTALLAMAEGEGDPNACFVLAPPARLDLSAGVQPIGVTRWRRAAGDTIRVELERGSHSSYKARFALRGSRLRGLGQRRTWRSDPPPAHIIEGRRLGPPDRSICTRAAERHLREIER